MINEIQLQGQELNIFAFIILLFFKLNVMRKGWIWEKQNNNNSKKLRDTFILTAVYKSLRKTLLYGLCCHGSGSVAQSFGNIQQFSHLLSLYYGSVYCCHSGFCYNVVKFVFQVLGLIVVILLCSVFVFPDLSFVNQALDHWYHPTFVPVPLSSPCV